MKTEDKPVTTDSDSISDEIAHAYNTWEPVPWTSLCGQKVKDHIDPISSATIKCVVCLELFDK